MDKIALKKELVKYIFPGTKPTIAQGEDGYIIYDFQFLYPRELAIFIPIEIERSRYSDFFPKSFEAYFRDTDKEIAYLSRLLETDLGNNFAGLGVEHIPGRVLRRDESNYTVFRFDEMVEPHRKTEALCRVKFDKLSANEYIRVLSINSYLRSQAVSLDGENYLYWIMPVGRFFSDINTVLAASIFAMVE